MPKQSVLRTNPATHPGVVGVMLRLGARSVGEISVPQLVDSHIDRVLEASDGSRTIAALALGLHRRSLQRMLNARRSSKRSNASGRHVRIGLRRLFLEQSMRVKSFENRIHAVIAEAASVITDIVRAELAAEVQRAVSSVHANGHANRLPKRLATAKTSVGGGRRRKRRGVDGATLARVLQVIKSKPGLRSEQIYEKLPLPRELTKKALAKLRGDKLVKTKGTRRATKYIAA